MKDFSRIVCWITLDPAAIVAAHYAIRDNEQSASPLPVAVACHRYIGEAALEQAAKYLGMPVHVVTSHQWMTFERPGDVNVYGVPVDEQEYFDALQHEKPDMPMANPVADRALRRDDCNTLASRAGLTCFVPMARRALKVAA